MRHKIHPLTQVLIALWFSALAIISLKLPVLVGLLLICVILLLISRIQTPIALGNTLLRISPLIAMILLIQLLAVRGGDPIGYLGSLTLYRQGLSMGTALGLRIMIILLAAKLLSRLSQMDFDAVFRSIRLPEEIGFMVAYAIHLLPGIAKLLSDSRRALYKRGINLKSLKLRQKIRLYGIIALRLVSELLQGSQTRAIALELRGFRSGIRSTRLKVYRFSWIDPLVWTVLIAAAIGLFNI